ncbi:MAG TPA: zinc metallopeptidase [Saprospiraceae bacterium]|nr:zinc metallopeptidase [Saprospiraceae bacterium]HMQ82286.1 zinc metallopeptidase [Saprospiraceae bacterium]
MMDYYGYMIVAGLISVVGMIVSQRLKSKFNHYSRIPIRAGLTGKQVAETMLQHFGIHDVKVVEGRGFLSDHYNPLSKTVSLSPDVYNGYSIASTAVAAHECGHAVQHAQSYSMLQLRSQLVPIVNFSAMAQQWLLIIAFMTLSSIPQVMLITIIAFAVTTLFSFITLPVEFDASKRALVWLDESGITRGEEYAGAKDALWWAAMTYVSAAISALVMLLYLVLRYSAATRD